MSTKININDLIEVQKSGKLKLQETQQGNLNYGMYI